MANKSMTNLELDQALFDNQKRAPMTQKKGLFFGDPRDLVALDQTYGDGSSMPSFYFEQS